MNSQQFRYSVPLYGMVAILLGLSLLPARAEGKEAKEVGSRRVDECMSGCVKSPSTPSSPHHSSTRIRALSPSRPATTIKDWMAQVEAATVHVTNVKLNPTDTGLEIVLDTQDAKPLQVDATQFRTEGNRLIADIPNAVLMLSETQAFTAENPTADIATVQVVQQDVNSIRVSVTGKNRLPTSEVTLRTGDLAYSLNPEADEPDEEIVVTGEGQGSYRVNLSRRITPPTRLQNRT